jgi:predicted metal-dependent HD superfamily phosphohydrolase
VNPQRWASLCARLGCPDPSLRFAHLEAAYSQPHRHYHNALHIQECLALFDSARHLASHPDEIEFALWLHDVEYLPRRSDNEESSAAIAVEWLSTCNVDDDVIDRIEKLILSTRHVTADYEGDEAILQDVDLGILGSEPARYAEYEAAIRREFRWVPGFLFRRRRAEILESFRQRETIYATSWFRERLERAARTNLDAAVATLRERAPL